MSGDCAEPQKSRPQVATASHGPRSAQRSAISNGKRLLPGVDNRNPWVRRAKDIIADLTSDKGGFDEVTAAEASLIRRSAVLSVELEALEARFAQAGQASERDLDLYSRTAGNLRRMLETIGLQRRPRTVGPSLSDILSGQIIEPEQSDEVQP